MNRTDLQEYLRSTWCSGGCSRSFLPTESEILAGAFTQSEDGGLVLRTSATVEAPAPTVSAVTITAATGNTSVAAGYRGLKVTATSANVTIEGAAVPEGYVFTAPVLQSNTYNTVIELAGTSYIVEEVR